MPLDGSTYVTKPDVLSVRGLRDWLHQQDGATTYDYWNTKDCLICRFARANGFKVHRAGGSFFYGPDSAERREIPGAGQITPVEPYTYAAALSRCNEYLQGRDSE